MTEAVLLKQKVIDLAANIFTRLVGDSTRLSEKGVTMTTDPANLAQLSFKLAAVFQKVEDDLNYEALPKNQNFKLEASDIAGWNK